MIKHKPLDFRVFIYLSVRWFMFNLIAIYLLYPKIILVVCKKFIFPQILRR